MSRNKNFEKLFDRTKSSAQILREEEDQAKVKVDQIQSWADFFSTTFTGTLAHPRNASCILRWHMPDYASYNPTGMDIQVPIMTIIEDSEGTIWLAYLTDPTEVHWKFLFLKPNPAVLLAYLREEKSLLEVFKTTPRFYLCTPDMEKDLLPVEPKDLPAEFIPGADATYNRNIWFEPADIYYGMNCAPYTRIVDWAKSDRFYWH